MTVPRTIRLPGHVRELFWEYDSKKIRWRTDFDLIVRKVLEYGRWESVTWLIKTVGHSALREWLVARNGAGLDAKKLRFWQIVLEIPRTRVDNWVTRTKADPWGNRIRH